MGASNPPESTGHRDGVFGLWEREGRVLLVKNPRIVGGERREMWDLPGGTVRASERLGAALVREWQEETGLEARIGDLLLVTDGAKRRAPATPPIYTWRAFVFRVDADGEARPGAGISAVDWVPRAEAGARLDAPYHAPLRRFLEGDETRGLAAVEWIEPLGARAESTGRRDDRLRRLCALAATAAAGRADLVVPEAEAALEEGVEPGVIRETLLQVVPYAGFPRAIAAFAAASGSLSGGGPEADGRAPFDADVGRTVFGEVYGDTADRVAEGLSGLDPALRSWTLRFAYGTVLSRSVLTLLEREQLAVAILTGLGRLEDPLLGHMRAVVRLGAGPDDVALAIAAVPHVLGEERRETAFRLMDRI